MKKIIGMVVAIMIVCDTYAELSDGLVAYYPLGSNALDHSAFTNNGTAFNVTYSEYGAYFDGTAGITVPESQSLHLGSKITVSVWLKVSSWGATGGNTGYPLVVFNNSSTYPSDPHERALAALISTNSSDFIIHSVDAYSSSVFASSRAASTASSESVNNWELDVPLGRWANLVWTYDGTNITSYLDGNQLYQNEFYASANDLSPYSGYQFIRIGHDQTGDSLPSFQGYMREVRIYDACLSSAGISQIYNMDTDEDGLSDAQELNVYGTDPTDSDSDDDGLSDGLESTNTYSLVSGDWTAWQDAKLDAESKGGHLATITSEDEFQYINSLFGTTLHFVWLGGSDEEVEGVWKWVTGEEWNYTNWFASQPDNYQNNQDYLCIWGQDGNIWFDASSDPRMTRYLFEIDATDPLDPDSDDDGLSDGVEINTYGTNPLNSDSDGDGLSDNVEIVTYDTNPTENDSDFDGLNDYEEIFVYSTNPNNRDMDSDGLLDGQEILTHNTDPELADTDSDGFNDGFEVRTGFNPTSNSSTPDLLSEIQTAIEFKFNAANGVSYRIEAADSLTNTWEIIEADIIGVGGVVNRLYSIEGQPKRFFRARRN